MKDIKQSALLHSIYMIRTRQQAPLLPKKSAPRRGGCSGAGHYRSYYSGEAVTQLPLLCTAAAVLKKSDWGVALEKKWREGGGH